MLELLDAIITTNAIGYMLVFLAAFLESMFAIGMFVPGQTVVMIAGIVSRKDPIHLFGFTSVAIIGAILGDLVSFELGRRYGIRVIPDFVHRKYISKTENFFRNHGGKSIFFGRMHSVLRAFVPFIAGIHKMSYKRFLFYNCLGGIVWGVFFVLIGYIFGLGVQRFEKYIGAATILVIIIFVAGFYAFEKFAEKKVETLKY